MTRRAARRRPGAGDDDGGGVSEGEVRACFAGRGGVGGDDACLVAEGDACWEEGASWDVGGGVEGDVSGCGGAAAGLGALLKKPNKDVCFAPPLMGVGRREQRGRDARRVVFVHVIVGGAYDDLFTKTRTNQ